MKLDVKPYKKRMKTLQDDFETWRVHLKEIQEYLCPRKGMFLDATTGEANSGKKRHSNIINNTGGKAADILANSFQGGMTRPSSEWFEVEVGDPDLNKLDSVKVYFAQVARILRRVFAGTNFYSATKSFYHELALNGTGVVYMEPDSEHVLRCHPFTAGEYYLAMNGAYKVDTLYRRFTMTVDQLVDKFGLENVCDQTKVAYNNNRLDEQLIVAHAIQPRRNRQLFKSNAENMPFSSVYWEEKAMDSEGLMLSGYPMQPFATSRWFAKGTSTYGWSPGMDELGDVKMLQKLEMKKLRAIDKFIDPPMNVPIGMRNVSLIPAGLNFHDPLSGGVPLAPTYQIQPQTMEISAEIARVMERIEKGFWNDIFMMISSDNDPNKTATEIAAKETEKLMLLGPVIESVQGFLSMLIERAYQIVGDWGLFPDPPQELQGQDYNIRFVGILAQAQRHVDTGSMGNWVGFVGNLAGSQAAMGRDPDAWDMVNTDVMVEQFAERLGVPPEVVRPDDQVAIIRAERAAQMQQQQQAAQAAQMADIGKTMSETKLDERSALNETVLGG